MSKLPLLVSLLLGASPGSEAPTTAPHVSTWSGDSAECIDVLFVGDGYTEEELVAGAFRDHVDRFCLQWLAERPFHAYRERFNIRLWELASDDSGCDDSLFEDEVDTALEAYFDSASGRVLKIGEEEHLADLVRRAGDVDIVFVLVNTDRYGGSGSVLYEIEVRGRPCPAPVFAAGHPEGADIALHELGHSFADLTDEYADPPLQRRYRLPWRRDIEHPNVTRRGQFDATSRETLRRTLKWSHFLDLPGAEEFPWIHEGAYYRERGCFRAWETCRMRSSRAPYCPVCCEQVAKRLSETCGLTWDADDHHRAHPLRLWTR